MPHSRSAAKRHRQSLRRRARNKEVKLDIKNRRKEVRASAAEGNIAQATEQLKSTVRALDVAAAKGVFHKNKTSRLKSRLSRAVKKAKAVAK